MTIALDIGASRFRSLRRQGTQLVGRSRRALYAVLPDSQARRELLERVDISYAACDNGLVLTDDDAAEFSRLFQVPCLPLLPGGNLPSDNPPARQILSWFVESLLPEPRQDEDICCLTLPGPKHVRRLGQAQEPHFLTHLVRLRGYQPFVLSGARAALFAELGHEAFTGIAISFGAATCEMSLARQGLEITGCSVPLGGDWIDRRLTDADPEFSRKDAGGEHVYVDEVTRWKETYSGSILHPKTDREAFLADRYRELIDQVLEEAKECLVTAPLALSLPHPISLILCGGTARVRGFGNLFQQMLANSSFPVRVQKVRIVADSDYTIARGCLIAAEIEQQAILNERRAA